LFNHDPNYLLGRTSTGTAKVSEDKRGLHYSVEVNAADPMAAGVAARIDRGDIKGSSFAFLVAAGGDEWTRTEKDIR
jgi:HK97 family phage prohead protease